MVKGVLIHDCAHTINHVLIGNFAVGLKSLVGIFAALAPESCNDMGECTLEEQVGLLVPGFHLLQGGEAGFLQFHSLPVETVGLAVVKRAHVGLGDRSGSPQNGLFPATGAGAIT